MNLYLFLLILSNFALLINGQTRRNVQKYYGRFIGSFPGTSHNVRGDVYAINENTIYIRDFSYDGAGPAAFFWTGSGTEPNPNGFIIPDELGRVVKLNAYNKQHIILTLTNGKTLRDIKWISVWCQLFTVNFGHVNIPPNFAYPKEHNLGPIPTLAHRTRADAVIIKDEKTLFLRNLHYDGAAPDAFFMIGTGKKPHEYGTKIPDENGSLRKIRGYRGQDITLRLPDNLTVFDFDWFGLFCISYRENFGHVSIPKNLNIPPDLKTLASEVTSFPNCETIFADLLQVSWEVRRPDIYIQIEGRVAPDQYISFGLSGSTQRAQMVGSDVIVAFFDSQSQKAKVVDYTLTAKAQCAPQSKSGACPDHVLGGKEDLELILWNYNEGVLKVSYKRKLYTSDDIADEEIVVDNNMVVVAAIGPLNSKREAAFHNIKYTKASDKPIKILFGRLQNERNCDLLAKPSHASQSRYSSAEPWKPSVIHAKNDQAFRVLIGPAGSDRGYTPITGVQSWGIAYWIDDMLIPEIHVQRGHNYTFVVEAGNNAANQARYHPLYITNNREGGGGQRPQELNTPSHMVYAGIDFKNNRPDPSPGAGRYCELVIDGIDMANISHSVEEYRKTLKLECEAGDVASFTWSPDENTPNVVYYQCFTHRNLGWKIIISNYSQRLASLHFIPMLTLVVIIQSML